MTRPFGNPLLARTALLACALAAGRAMAESDPYAGPMLSTNGDVDSLITTAASLIEGGQYSQAVVRLQVVMDKFPNVLTTTDDRRYTPARLRAQQMIAAAGPEALAAYRASADGYVCGLLPGPASPAADAYALRQIVDRYFISSDGDDAAYALGCMRLDRYDFPAARRLFRKILREHPDPSVNMAELHLRLALACARLGDRTGAERSLKALENMPQVDPQRVALVRAQLDQAASRPQAGLTLPTADDELGWVDTWRYQPPVALQTLSRRDEARILKEWRQAKAPPLVQAVADNGKIAFKAAGHMTCLDARDGRLVWQQEASAITTGVLEAYTNSPIRNNPAIRRRSGRPGIQLPDRALFDRCAAINGQLYHLTAGSMMANRYNRQAAPLHLELAAVDMATGKTRWQADRIERGGELSEAIRAHFIGTPVACGSYIVAPAIADRELRLAALDPSTGRTAWSAECYRTTGDADRAPGLAAVDDHVYLAAGDGLVMCFDADGRITWASRYPRDEVREEIDVENIAAICGDRLVVMANDAPGRLLVFDLGNGTPLDEIDIHGATRWIGQTDGRAYLAGAETVLCVAPAQANDKPLWRTEMTPATGRAALVGDSVLFAGGANLVRLDASTGRIADKWTMPSPRSTPVGNLLCASGQLVSLGPTGAVAWVDANARMAELATKIAAGDGEALAERAALYQKLNRTDRAIDDLRKLDQPESRRTLVRLLLAADRIDEAAKLADTPALAAAVKLARADQAAKAKRYDEAAGMYVDLLRADDAMIALDASGDLRAQASQIARKRLAELDGGSHIADLPAEPAIAASTPKPFGPPPWKLVWQYRSAGVRLVTIDHPTADRSQFWQNHLLFFSAGWGQLTCRRAVDRAPVWTVPIDENMQDAIAQTAYGQTLRAAVCGSTLIVRAATRLVGIDQQTGEIRWQRDAPAVEPGALYFPEQPLELAAAADCDGQMLIHLSRDPATGIDRVEAIDPATGKLRWSRDVVAALAGGVRLIDGHALIALASASTVYGQQPAYWLCDRRTGEIERTWLSDAQQKRIAIADIGGRLPGIEPDELTGDSIKFEPTEVGKGNLWADLGGLYVIRQDENIRAYDAATGARRWAIRERRDSRASEEAALGSDGNVWVLCRRAEPMVDGVAIIDGQTGRLVTRLNPSFLSAVPLRVEAMAVGGAVPFVEPNNRVKGQSRLVFYDSGNGDRYNDKQLPIPGGDQFFNSLRRQPIVRSGLLITASDEGVLAFGPEGDTDDRQGIVH